MPDRFITLSFYLFLGLSFLLGWPAISLIQLHHVVQESVIRTFSAVSASRS